MPIFIFVKLILNTIRNIFSFIELLMKNSKSDPDIWDFIILDFYLLNLDKFYMRK